MKILVCLDKPNYRYESLIEPIRKTKQIVGTAIGGLDEREFYKFAPDVVIHNIPNVTSFPADGKFISINLNETNSDNSFSIIEGSKNYIEPFVIPRKSAIYGNKYKSELLYIGDPSIFGKDLPLLISRNLKILHSTPIPIIGYSGSCGNDYYKFYRHARLSLVKDKSDLYRIRDIVMNDGTPIAHDEPNLLERIDSKTPLDCESREEILRHHTNYDRASFIFKRIGLEKISKLILQAKDKV